MKVVILVPRTQLISLRTGLLAAAIAAAFALVCAVAGAAADPANAPNGRKLIFNGTGTDDARVILYALGDHLSLGVCARKDPEAFTRSWSAPLVALPGTLLAGNAECGKHVTVSNVEGTSETATVVGRCSNCSGSDISLSPILFKHLAPATKLYGSIPVTWSFVN
jgi:hypothetical protein